MFEEKFMIAPRGGHLDISQFFVILFAQFHSMGSKTPLLYMQLYDFKMNVCTKFEVDPFSGLSGNVLKLLHQWDEERTGIHQKLIIPGQTNDECIHQVCNHSPKWFVQNLKSVRDRWTN